MVDCVKFTSSRGRVRHGIIVEYIGDNMARVLWDEWPELLLDIQRPTERDLETVRVHSGVIELDRERRGSSLKVVGSDGIPWNEPGLVAMVNHLESTREGARIR